MVVGIIKKEVHMAVGNIACSFPNCTNPVIGQCTGYKKACGKYYCREHSTDTLCSDCASLKLAEDQAQEILEDYLHTAEKIEQEALLVFDGKTFPFAHFLTRFLKYGKL
jgi:hypothetical protein